MIALFCAIRCISREAMSINRIRNTLSFIVKHLGLRLSQHHRRSQYEARGSTLAIASLFLPLNPAQIQHQNTQFEVK